MNNQYADANIHKSTTSRKVALSLGVALLALTSGGQVSAAPGLQWEGAVSDDWTDGDNWLGGVAPSLTGPAAIVAPSASNPAPVIDDAVGEANALFLGSQDHANLTIRNGGQLNANNVVVGNSTNNASPGVNDESGAILLTGAGSGLSVEGLTVGYYGDGALNIADGAKAIISANTTVGAIAGAKGVLTLADANSRLEGGDLYIGSGGEGEFSMSAGTSAQTKSSALGVNAGSSGTATIAGADTNWAITGSLSVGSGGTGDMTISDGAVVSATGDISIGRQASGSGTLLVSGENSQLTTATNLFVGFSGAGDATVNDGGTMSADKIILGFDAGSSGTLVVDGANSVVKGASYVMIGYSKDGEATISNGGTLKADGARGVTIGFLADSKGTLNIGAAAGEAAAAAGHIDAVSGIKFGPGAGRLVLNHTDTDYVLAAPISGIGAVDILSGTTIFSGDSSLFSGSFTVDGGKAVMAGATGAASTTVNTGGVLQIGNGGTSGSLNSDIVNNGALVFNRSDALLHSRVISGGGSLNVAGGTITLSGMNSFTGATSIDAGATLALSGQGRIKDSSGVTVNGTLDVRAAAAASIKDLDGSGTVIVGNTGLSIKNASQTFSGQITGTGGLMVEGGTLTLTGASTFENGLGIRNGATVNIGGGGTSGSITSNVTNFGTLVFDRSDDISYAGKISGQGTVIKTGANTATFSNSINGMQLNVQNGTAVLLSTMNGNANIGAQGKLVFANHGTAIYQGVLSGTGAVVKAGAGTSMFSGDSSLFSGSFTVDGGTAILAGATGAANTTINSGGILQIGNGGTTGSLNSNIVNNGALVFSRADALLHNREISGSGSLTVVGGAITLSGMNTYTGATRIETGATLALSGQGRINQSSGVTVNGTLDVRGASSAQIKDLGGKGTVIVGNAGLHIKNASQTFSGQITGTGGLMVEGGTLTLTGASTFENGLGISNGAIVNIGGGGTSGSITSNVTNFGTLVFDRSNDTTYAGQISGQGTVIKTGANTMTFTGAISGTPLDVQQGTAVLLGTINSNAHIGEQGTLVFARPTTSTYRGTLSGTGSVVKAGEGTTIFSGNSSGFAGDATVSGGTLLLTGSLGGDLLIDTAGTLQLGDGIRDGNLLADTVNNGTLIFNQIGDYDYAGALSGNGNLIKRGNGTLLLSGDYGYTGSTVVEGGIVRLTSLLDTESDLVLNGGVFDLGGLDQQVAGLTGTGGTLALGIGELTVMQNENTSFAGVITGTGGFNKGGTGLLNLTGTSSFTGQVDVNGGRLAVNGTMPGSFSVNNGGTLGGTGTTGTLVVNNGGTLAPGNSIGTLNVAGNVQFNAGSVFEVEVDAAGNGDLVNVSGTAKIQGGTVSVLAAAGAYRWTSDYVILTAAGGVTGTFAGVDVDLPFLNPYLIYSANNVMLTLARNDRSFVSAAVSANQRAVALALDTSVQTGPLYRAVAGQTNVAGAKQAFNALSGELWATTSTFMVDGTRRLGEMVVGRMEQADTVSYALSNARNAARQTDGGRTGIWGQALGSWNSAKSDGNAVAATQNSFGFITGIDTMLGDWRVGVAFNHGEDKVQLGDRDSRATVKGSAIAAYAGGGWGKLRARVGGSYGWQDVKGTRHVTFPSVSEKVSGEYDAKSASAFAEMSYAATLGKLMVEPFAGANHVRLKTDGFVETGGALTALTVDSQTRDVTYTTLGLRLGATLPVSERAVITPRVSAAWLRGFGDLAAEGRHTLTTGKAFSIEGLPATRDALRLEAGVQANILPGGSLGVSYVGNLADRWSDHGLKLGFSYSF